MNEPMTPRTPHDPDFIGACAAIERAAQRALETALQLGTPCWVMVDGNIVDLAARYREQMQAALGDPRPGVTSEDVKLHFAQRRAALGKRIENET